MAQVQILTASSGQKETDSNTWTTVCQIPAGSFTAGDKYLILAVSHSMLNDSAQELQMRLVHGTTPTQFTDAYEADEVLGNKVVGIGFMTVYTQPGTAEAVTLEYRASTNGLGDDHRIRWARIVAINLDDIGTQNTDYWYSEDTTDHALSTTPTDGASLTFTPNGTDKYLYIAQATWAPNDNSIEQTFHTLLYDGSVVQQVSEEGEDATNLEQRNRLLVWANTPTNASHTVKVQGRMEAGTSSTTLSSRVFALNLSKFADSHIATPADHQLTALDTWQNAWTTSFTPSASQDYFVLSHVTEDYGSDQNPDVVHSLQINPDGNGLYDYPGTVKARDTFTEASTVNLSSHTADSGQSWTQEFQSEGTVRWEVVGSTDVAHIVGGSAVYGTSQSSITGLTLGDGYVEFRLVSGGDGVGVTVRLAGSGSSYNGYQLYHTGAAMGLYRVSSGAQTSLGSVTGGPWYRIYASSQSPTELLVFSASTQATLRTTFTDAGFVPALITTDATAGLQVTSGKVGIFGIYDDEGLLGGSIDDLRVVEDPFLNSGPDGGAWDAADETPWTFMDTIPFTSGASRTINYDHRQSSAGTTTRPSVVDPVFVAFSKELAGGGSTTYNGSFTADAHIKKTISGTFTANAYIQKTTSGTFTADAEILKTTSGAVTADAYISKTTSGTFTADAAISSTVSGSFTIDANIKRTMVYQGSGSPSFEHVTRWSGSGTAITSGAISTLKQDALVLVAVHTVANASPTSITGCGLTFEQVGWQGYWTNASPSRRVEIWRAQGSPTPGTITVNYAVSRTADIRVVQWDGVAIGNNGADAIRNGGGGFTDNGGAMTATLPAFHTDGKSAGYGFGAISGGQAISAEAGWTAGTTTSVSGYASNDTRRTNTTDNTVTQGWSAPTRLAGIYAVEIRPAGFAGAGLTADAHIKNTLSATFTADAKIGWLRQMKAGNDDQTFDTAAQAGNLLIMMTDSSSTGAVTAWPTGFTELISERIQSGGGNGRIAIAYKVADGGETLLDATYSTTTRVHISEWALPRPWRLDVVGFRRSVSSFNPYVDLTPTAATPLLLIGAIGLYSYDSVGNAISVGTNQIEMDEGGPSGTDSGMSTQYREVQSPTGTYRFQATYGGTDRFEIAAAVTFVQGDVGSFTADAWIGSAATTYPGSFTADAIIEPAHWSTWSATWSMDVQTGQIGNFTADAFIKRTFSGSLTADAYIKKTTQGSLTADAYISATTAGTFTADAAIQNTYAGTFTADANVLTVSSGSFTADAHISKTVEQAFTADAFIFNTVSGSFTADANIVNSVNGSFTADAHISKTVAGSFTADANITNTVAGTFTADADILLTTSGTFTIDAVITRSFSDTFTADAHIAKTTEGTFTADATVQATVAGAVTADAYIATTTAGSFTADATLSKTTSGSFTADAFIDLANWSAWSATWSMDVQGGVFGNFTADAHIARTFESSFSANAFIQKTFSGSVTADAFIQQVYAGAFTADADIKQTYAGSFTADAEILRTWAGAFTADATIQKTTEQSFVADAHISSAVAGTFTADAYILTEGTVEGSFTADANISATVESSFTADANIAKTIAGNFTADAIIQQTVAGAFTADGHIASTIAGAFTADAVIKQTYAGSFTADAEILVVQPGSFTADAEVLRIWQETFTADAHIKKTIASTFTADAIVSKTYGGTFVADAVIDVASWTDWSATWSMDVTEGAITYSGTFTADAHVKREFTGSFSADAYVKQTYQSTVTADAHIAATIAGSFTADAEIAVTGTVTGDFTADAYVQNTLSGSFSADAYVRQTTAGTFTADAVVVVTYPGSFVADANIAATVASTFTADAWIAVEGTVAGDFTADAFIKATITDSLTADAYILRTWAGSLTADSHIKSTISGSLTADAYVKQTLAGSFTADAAIRKTTAGTLTADADILVVSTGSFTADAIIDNPSLARSGRGQVGTAYTLYAETQAIVTLASTEHFNSLDCRTEVIFPYVVVTDVYVGLEATTTLE